MKVALKESVKKVGEKYDIVEVADGFARNFLLPNNLATPVTEGEVVHHERVQEERKKAEAKKLETLKQRLKDIEGMVIHMTARANEQGHLFAGVTQQEVLDKVREQAHIDDLPESSFEGPDVIKEVGEHSFTVVIGDEQAEVVLELIPESN